MAVARIGIERDIGDEAEVREFALDRPAGAANEIVFVEGFAAGFVFERGFGVGEESDRRDGEPDGALGFAQGLIEADPIDARHGGDRGPRFASLDQEQRPNEIGRGQDMLGDQPARPVRFAVPSRAMGEVEPQRGGGCFDGRAST